MLQVTIEGTGYWGFGDLDWWESADSLCWVNLRDVSITCFSCFQIVALPNDPGLVDDLRGTVVEAMPSRSIKYIGKWSSLLFLWIQPTSEFVDFAKNISTQRRWVEHFFLNVLRADLHCHALQRGLWRLCNIKKPARPFLQMPNQFTAYNAQDWISEVGLHAALG